MRKSLMVLAILSTMSAPVLAQTATTAAGAPTAKPQTVKKRVCIQTDEDSYSRLGGRKICKTVEVPVEQQSQSQSGGQGQQAPAAANTPGQ
jgi:hypothetical protein